MKDLIVLVADKNMQFLIKGVLPRISRIEGLMDFTFDSFIHPYRDPGIFNEADEFLRPFSKKYSYAIVMLDHDGSGQEKMNREEIEKAITAKLNRIGWERRNAVICIQPELENWIWVNQVKMQEAISWQEEIGLYDWLHQSGLKNKKDAKPHDPKGAFEKALKISHTPRSSSLYLNLAKKASYKKCIDPAFNKMLNQLREWFKTDN
jgi:hypothetical protein